MWLVILKKESKFCKNKVTNVVGHLKKKIETLPTYKV